MVLLYLIGSIFIYDVINWRSQDHNVKVYDGIRNTYNMYDDITNVWPIIWYFKIHFMPIKLAYVCTLSVLSSVNGGNELKTPLNTDKSKSTAMLLLKIFVNQSFVIIHQRLFILNGIW